LTLGSDVSGTVVALGAGVGAFALDEAVYDATNDQFVGGYAEYALVEAGKIAPKPAALDHVTAAGLPVVAVTAWQMLFEHARIEPGQTILGEPVQANRCLHPVFLSTDRDGHPISALV